MPNKPNSIFHSDLFHSSPSENSLTEFSLSPSSCGESLWRILTSCRHDSWWWLDKFIRKTYFKHPTHNDEPPKEAAHIGLVNFVDSFHSVPSTGWHRPGNSLTEWQRLSARESTASQGLRWAQTAKSLNPISRIAGANLSALHMLKFRLQLELYNGARCALHRFRCNRTMGNFPSFTNGGWECTLYM